MESKVSPVEIKVVVIAYFHSVSNDGSMEGELKHWMRRWKLDREIDFPQGDDNLWMSDDGVLGIAAGIGANTATAAIMGLGMDPRFDLTRAYWVVAGVGGANPNAMTIGSVAWARYVVDADKKHMLDPREMPDNWRFGTTPYGVTTEEFPQPVVDSYRTAFRLNPILVNWAFELTRDIDVDQYVEEADKAHCQRFASYDAATGAARVILGEVAGGDNFWHGRMMNEWATAWVDYWTAGEGQFSICCCEDAGTMTALTLLDKAGRVDIDRVLVSRSASNFVCQWDGATAGESLATEDVVELSGLSAALESAYAVCSSVVRELSANWDQYKDHMPTGRT